MGVGPDLIVAGITAQSKVVAARAQVSCDLAGEAAVLNLTSGIYYGLDEVGASVWQLIQAPAIVDSICAALGGQYETDRATLEADVCAFLTEMMNEGLVELSPDEPSVS